MSVVLAPTFGVGYQAFTTTGLPLNAGKIYTYAAGSSTPQAVYTTSIGNVQHQNPIILGTDGRIPTGGEVWLTLGTAYKFEVQDSLGNVIADYDNIGNSTDIATATVASAATTSDIWSPLGPISFTGTATVTGFPAAPLAGAQRLLICSGACLFTTGANLIIEGLPSGVTLTMKANALVMVLALTTTQFKLTYSLSGSFTASATGLTAAVTTPWYYSVINGVVNISGYAVNLAGTSNSTGLTVTGFPAELTPGSNRLFFNLVAADGGSFVYTAYGVLANTGVLTLYKDPSGTGWTNTATGKGLYTNNFAYLLGS